MSIHQADGLSRKRVASLGAWLALSGMLLLPGYGKAQLVAMNDAGSTANIDLGSSAGMYGCDRERAKPVESAMVLVPG